MNQISQIAFTPDGVVITYLDLATDVRNEGRLLAHHVLHIDASSGRDYLDEVENLQEAAKALLADALEDFHNTEPWGQPALPGMANDDDEED